MKKRQPGKGEIKQVETERRADKQLGKNPSARMQIDENRNANDQKRKEKSLKKETEKKRKVKRKPR